MAKNDTTSAIIDGLLQILIVGGLLATTLAAPNAVQALDKPLARYFKALDKRTREREYRRVLRYMKKQGLIQYRTEDYEHGIQITKGGKERAEKAKLDSLFIARPKSWDKKWRLVFFDIPETNKQARDHLTRKLKDLEFRQLQKSVWIHPFPCRDEVATVVHQYNVSNFVTYIETSFIDSQDKLKARFPFNF
jgi:DNA-binding transcriptional regulator PaaX